MTSPRNALAGTSLGLIIVALLVPFIIAALGRADLAVCFSIVSLLLALVLAAFSRSVPFGRRVLVCLLLLLPLGGAASVAITSIWRNRVAAKQARPMRIQLQAEQERLKEADRANQTSAPATPNPR
jgi:hypothetical protein